MNKEEQNPIWREKVLTDADRSTLHKKQLE